MEHSYVGNWYVKEYERALAEEFYGYPLVWSGDYADNRFNADVHSKALEFIDNQTRKNAKALGYRKNENGRWGEEYIRDGVTATEKSLAVAVDYDMLASTTYEYIINFTKKMFIRIPKKGEGLTIHPLPLLCADGNGRGGGDYEGTNMELIGSWAFDRIGVSNELPKSIKTELVATFQESYEGGDSSVNDYSYIPRK